MPQHLLSEALKRLAAEAATRFSTLVASGDPIPFDIAEQAGPASRFHSYLPLTWQYVRERESELRALPAFEQAREAVDAAGIAARYLEEHGEAVPADPREQAARMLAVFISSLWDGCTEFSLDRARLDGALEVLDAEIRNTDDAEVLLAPVVGFKMPEACLRLPHGVQLVRADSVDAPAEAMRSDSMDGASWEPRFLAIAEQGDEADSCEAAMRRLRGLVTVLRLFKAGGAGLGPHAFAPTGKGHWRRLATGAAAPCGCGYRLSADEAVELAGLAGALEARPEPAGALAWAIARFEMGCERRTTLEALSDHLLALRAVLEGQGPVGASLPMRAAALITADGGEREAARERIERALELERSLMSGRLPAAALELVDWVEGSVRIMLREAALGELGADLGAAADETLIATGLEAGDAEIAVTVQEPVEAVAAEPAEMPRQEEDMEDTRILEPAPGEDEIRITATDWLDEVATGETTLEWPAGGGEVGRRGRVDTPRVRHLFPVPEDANWEIRELEYDHYRQSRAS